MAEADYRSCENVCSRRLNCAMELFVAIGTQICALRFAEFVVLPLSNCLLVLAGLSVAFQSAEVQSLYD